MKLMVALDRRSSTESCRSRFSGDRISLRLPDVVSLQRRQPSRSINVGMSIGARRGVL